LILNVVRNRFLLKGSFAESALNQAQNSLSLNERFLQAVLELPSIGPTASKAVCTPNQGHYDP